MNDFPISRVERKKKETRDRILAVAEQIFIVEGSYEQTTIREIAKRADIGLGSVYLHFKTKSDILGALLAAHTNMIKNTLKKYLPAEASGAEKLEAILSFFDVFRKDERFALYGRYSTGRPLTGDEEVRKAVDREVQDFIRIVTEVLRTGREDGSLRFAGEPELAAMTFINFSTAFMRDIFCGDAPILAILIREYGVDVMFSSFVSFVRGALGSSFLLQESQVKKS